MKSEPAVYGINHLKAEGETLWDGIRNYQARNFMRTMKDGDKAFFYHSNCKPPGIVGLMKIVDTGLVDPSQFDSINKCRHPKSTQDNPRWDCAKLAYLGTFCNPLSLDKLRDLYSSEALPVLRKGNRLSILPVPTVTAKSLLKHLGKLK